MKNIVSICVFLLIGTAVQAQYWIGPKVGFHRVDHVYQDPEYKADTFKIIPNYNFQAGAVLTYTATEMFGFHSEIVYERIGRRVTNRDETPAYSKSVNNFISIPLQLRVSFFKRPFHMYLNGGPKISYWMGGSGRIDLDEFLDDSVDPIDYNIKFGSIDEGAENQLAITEANRIQYALTAGGGIYIDLAIGGRLELDFRYSFGHSNMGKNSNPDFTFYEYYENFRHRNNMLSVSVAYMLEYDAQLKRRGQSTNKLSNKK